MKKNSNYAWISLVLALFFWVPILSLVFLAASVFFGVKAIYKCRKEPQKYGGFYIALISVIFAVLAFFIAAFFLYLSVSGKSL